MHDQALHAFDVRVRARRRVGAGGVVGFLALGHAVRGRAQERVARNECIRSSGGGGGGGAFTELSTQSCELHPEQSDVLRSAAASRAHTAPRVAPPFSETVLT
eukprot:1480340-Pleurochrysis_carterae.AAC.4